LIRTALLVLAASLALYGATLGHFFVSDDFLNFERNRLGSPGDAVAFFSTGDVDFWRPLARLHVGVLRAVAGDRVVVWNLTGVVLHALAAWLVAALAASCLGPRSARAAGWAGVFFAVHFIHPEAVVWASAVTTLWSTIFVLAALLAFRRARRTGRARDRAAAVLAFAAGLAAKEEAVAFVPLLFLTTWWWPVEGAGTRSRLPSARELAPFAIVVAAWAVVVGGIDRGGDASPYRVELGAHVARNAAFFALGGFVPLRFWEVRDLCAGTGVGPCLAGLARRPDLALPMLAGLLALAWLAGRGSRDVRGGLLWIFLAAGPFLLLTGSGERFLYLPSAGACLVWALVCQELFESGTGRGRRAARLLAAAALALHVAGNVDRQRDWSTAAAWTRGITDLWTVLEPRDPETPVELAGIPGEWRSAWVFRNGFDSMVRLYWRGRPYVRQGEHPDAPSPAERLAVILRPDGTVRTALARPTSP
jgi:hypothetical protein